MLERKSKNESASSYRSLPSELPPQHDEILSEVTARTSCFQDLATSSCLVAQGSPGPCRAAVSLDSPYNQPNETCVLWFCGTRTDQLLWTQDVERNNKGQTRLARVPSQLYDTNVQQITSHGNTMNEKPTNETWFVDTDDLADCNELDYKLVQLRHARCVNATDSILSTKSASRLA
jgi:hypothetical protein